MGSVAIYRDLSLSKHLQRMSKVSGMRVLLKTGQRISHDLLRGGAVVSIDGGNKALYQEARH